MPIQYTLSEINVTADARNNTAPATAGGPEVRASRLDPVLTVWYGASA